MEGGGGDLLSAQAGLLHWQAEYGLPQKLININDTASIPNKYLQDQPSLVDFAAKRINAHGLRGNWLSSHELHGFMASLLSKPGAETDYSQTAAGYFPNGDCQVYKYYYQDMTEYRVGTLPSADLKFDCHETMDTHVF
jgi:hypothetical protein